MPNSEAPSVTLCSRGFVWPAGHSPQSQGRDLSCNWDLDKGGCREGRAGRSGDWGKIKHGCMSCLESAHPGPVGGYKPPRQGPLWCPEHLGILWLSPCRVDPAGSVLSRRGFMASGALTSYLTNPACLAGHTCGLLGEPAPHLPVTPPPFPDVRCREGLVWSDE